jgi:hypothetical protein
VCIERLLDRTTDIKISEDHHGPADNRSYSYAPTHILRGLTELHLEWLGTKPAAVPALSARRRR